MGELAAATAGSYGVPPAGYRLPEATRLGTVRLQVAQLPRSRAYYQQVLGLRLLSEAPGTASLGAAGSDEPLVELVERAGARPSGHGLLGLYHVAILLPTRGDLGRFVRHLGALGVRAGAGDHLVSEAFYLTDPDGLGIEVYADRPRAQWQRQGRELMLATDLVDVRGLLAVAGDAPWGGMPAGTCMGHVHLHVGNLAGAAGFYGDGLGFDRMTWRYPGALFLGAGGYHHHVGTNTWAGAGARPPAADDAQLLAWTLVVPDAAQVDAVAASLTAQGAPVTRAGRGDLLARDPWGTAVRVVA
jgi:catechol 2,3-dioxygenase